jgi:hypothetical protein
MAEVGGSSAVQPQENNHQTIPASIDPLHDLSSTFNSRFSISESARGEYRVKTFMQNEGGSYPAARQFPTVEDAIKHYLESREISGPERSYLRVPLSTNEMSYESYDDFGKSAKLKKEPTPLTERANKLVETTFNSDTYAATVDDPDWTATTFKVVTDYFSTPEGSQILTRLGVEDIKLLTPNQAMQMSLEITRRLTKYYSAKQDTFPTPADQSTVAELLKLGMTRKADPDFEGNGVCRNFATMVKVVFDSIKSNQHSYNYLQDTYCGIDIGPENVFSSKFQKHERYQYQSKTPTHAWNKFITIQGRKISMVTVDPTWTQIDSSGKLTEMEYTRQRNAQAISELLSDLPSDEDSQNVARRAIAEHYVAMVDSASFLAGIPFNEDTAAALQRSSEFRDFRAKHQTLDLKNCQKIYLRQLNKDQIKNMQQYHLQLLTEVLRYTSVRNILPEDRKMVIMDTFIQNKPDLERIDVSVLFKLASEGDDYLQEQATVIIRRYIHHILTSHSFPKYQDFLFKDQDLQNKVLGILDQRNPSMAKNVRREWLRELKHLSY